MTTETIISSVSTKKFLLVEIDDTNYNVQVITVTSKEIEDGELNKFGAYPDEEYSVFSASGTKWEIRVNQMDPGDAVELGSGITLTRLA